MHIYNIAIQKNPAKSLYRNYSRLKAGAPYGAPADSQQPAMPTA